MVLLSSLICVANASSLPNGSRVEVSIRHFVQWAESKVSECLILNHILNLWHLQGNRLLLWRSNLTLFWWMQRHYQSKHKVLYWYWAIILLVCIDLNKVNALGAKLVMPNYQMRSLSMKRPSWRAPWHSRTTNPFKLAKMYSPLCSTIGVVDRLQLLWRLLPSSLCPHQSTYQEHWQHLYLSYMHIEVSSIQAIGEESNTIPSCLWYSSFFLHYSIDLRSTDMSNYIERRINERISSLIKEETELYNRKVEDIEQPLPLTVRLVQNKVLSRFIDAIL